MKESIVSASPKARGARVPSARQDRDALDRTQRQWDATFKALIPKAPRLWREIERHLSLADGALSPADKFSTDIPSSVVGAALHWSSPFKELRADGVHLTDRGIVVASEYQSTFNAGMRLRFAMYREAIIEHNTGLNHENWIYILFFSGAKRIASRHYGDKFFSKSPGYINMAIVLIEQSNTDALENGSVEDLIIRLTLLSATEMPLFRRALRRIDVEIRDPSRATSLRLATLAASINKPVIAKELYGEILMEENLRRGFEALLPLHMKRVITQAESEVRAEKIVECRDFLKAIVKSAGADLSANIDGALDDELIEWGHMFQLSADVDQLVSWIKDAAPRPGG